MRVDVDIPDELLIEASGLARRLGWTVNRLVAEALRDHIARRSGDDVGDGFTDVSPCAPCGDASDGLTQVSLSDISKKE